MQIPIAQIQTHDVGLIKAKLAGVYQSIVREFGQIIQSDLNLELEWKQLNQSDRRKLAQFGDICRTSSLFFTAFFTTHVAWVEEQLELAWDYQLAESLRKGLQYVVEFSKLPDEQIFKICVEFWHSFARHVVNQGCHA